MRLTVFFGLLKVSARTYRLSSLPSFSSYLSDVVVDGSGHASSVSKGTDARLR